MSARPEGQGTASVRVKICGVTSVADARAAVAAGADMIGLNFYTGSKRCISLERAREIVAALPSRVWKVGLFVNATREEIDRMHAALRFDAIQLHGDEAPEMTQGFAVPVIRTLKLRGAGDAQRALSRFRADYYLCEGDAGAAYGGAGATFDWDLARCTELSTKFKKVRVAFRDATSRADLEQEHVEIFIELIIEFGTIEKTGDFAEDASPGFFETTLKLNIWFGLAPEQAAEYHEAHLTREERG